MTSPRHNAIATHAEHGLGYCIACFWEAIRFADEMTLEMVVRRLRGQR